MGYGTVDIERTTIVGTIITTRIAHIDGLNGINDVDGKR
jgi:hypothetical protein